MKTRGQALKCELSVAGGFTVQRLTPGDTVEVLDGPDAGEGLANALFIDVIGRPVVGARGEVRRTARRVNRREEYREEAIDDRY